MIKQFFSFLASKLTSVADLKAIRHFFLVFCLKSVMASTQWNYFLWSSFPTCSISHCTIMSVFFSTGWDEHANFIAENLFSIDECAQRGWGNFTCVAKKKFSVPAKNCRNFGFTTKNCDLKFINEYSFNCTYFSAVIDFRWVLNKTIMLFLRGVSVSDTFLVLNGGRHLLISSVHHTIKRFISV